jgi:hypothetical protein
MTGILLVDILLIGVMAWWTFGILFLVVNLFR